MAHSLTAMAYRYSGLDKENLEWFNEDTSKRTLIRLEIEAGNLRGLRELQLHFRYPITALSGKNGTGKSTLLACVACGFHNSSTGYVAAARRSSYYTFSDFFFQTTEDIAPRGVVVKYQILHNNWRISTRMPNGTGLGWQYRIKKTLGKWNNYDSRVSRNVVYLGIERVVPHAEKSVSKSYRHAFKKQSLTGYEEVVRETVGRIIGRAYDDFFFKTHTKYRLPLVQFRGQTYSGFNMGTGENALFEIFSTIYACPDSLLLIIDEIELGLHEEAQIKLIEELKKICRKRHIQIICTTHSTRILSALPPEGRIHLERLATKTEVIPEISADYAGGLMSGIPNVELDILCEDEVAKNILLFALPNDIRLRVKIIPIGSAAAVARHLAARFKENPSRPVCGVLDGDKRQKKQEHINLFLKALETTPDKKKATLWIEERFEFLPGSTWPEKWVIEKYGGESFKKLIAEFSVTEQALDAYVESAKLAEKHSEFYELSKKLSLEEDIIQGRFIKCALEESSNEAKLICKFIRDFLK